MSGNDHLDVGQQLRRLRSESRLSLRALARDSGLSVNAISRIERGESSPTVSSLQRLAQALGKDITEFFKAAPERSTVVVREHQRARTRGEGLLLESLGTGLPGQRMGPFLMTLMPGACGAEEPISHAGEEFVYCLEGEVDYKVQGEWQRLRAGDSLIFLASQPHLCRNTGLEKARLLLVIQAPSEEIGSAQQQHLMIPEPGRGKDSRGAGTARPGTGTTPRGAGAAPPDAGTAPPDAGTAPPDAGTAPPDGEDNRKARTQPFDEHSDRYEAWFHAHGHAYRAEVRALKELMPPGGQGLEVGVGTGRFAAPLGISLGLDPSLPMLAVAREQGIRIVKGVGEHLPFPDGSLDLVLMVTTVCFLEDLDGAFREANRVLRPGGHIVVGLVDRETPLGKAYLQRQAENVFYRVARFYTVEEIVAALARAGFGEFSFRQTLFGHPGQTPADEPVLEGHGTGSFVALRGRVPESVTGS
jgi:SAM-dependent methyltransferase/transcriptional regulator with XRE-family HTH domain